MNNLTCMKSIRLITLQVKSSRLEMLGSDMYVVCLRVLNVHIKTCSFVNYLYMISFPIAFSSC